MHKTAKNHRKAMNPSKLDKLLEQYNTKLRHTSPYVLWTAIRIDLTQTKTLNIERMLERKIQ